MTETIDTAQPEAVKQFRQRLIELFLYKEGVLINKTVRNNQHPIGSKAGRNFPNGYTNIRVDGKMFKAHRLIYLLHHGELPDFVDHID